MKTDNALHDNKLETRRRLRRDRHAACSIHGMSRERGRQLNHMAIIGVFLTACAVCIDGRADPSVEVTMGRQPAAPGKPFPVTIEISWQGAADDYLVFPPEIPSIDWGSAELTKTETFSEGDRFTVAHRIEFTPWGPGEYETPEITIAFSSPKELQSPPTAGNPGSPPGPDAPPTLRASPQSLSVYPDRTSAWTVGGLGALLLLLLPVGWGLARRFRRRRPPADTAPEAVAASIEEAASALAEARRHRVHGSFYEYYLCLARCAHACGAQAASLSERLERRAREIGYGGLRPPDVELDADLRDVERALAQASPRGDNAVTAPISGAPDA